MGVCGSPTPYRGVRFEELHELSHHSIIQYRLPSTSELVSLLQTVPSKADAERLLVSPKLAYVLSAIVEPDPRPHAAIALVPIYDTHEKPGIRPCRCPDVATA